MITSHIIENGVMGPRADGLPDLATLTAGERWAWIDTVDPAPEDLAVLTSRLGLHPLFVEDAADEGQRPKAAFFDDQTVLVLRSLSFTGGELTGPEMHIVFTQSWLLTIRFSPVVTVRDSIVSAHEQVGRRLSGINTAVYAILALVGDTYLAVAQQLRQVGDDFEDAVSGLSTNGSVDQRSMVQLRRNAVLVRRVALTTVRAVERLKNHTPQGDPLQPYLSDVLDDLRGTAEQADELHHTLTAIGEMQAADAANDLNIAGRVLAAWAGILLIPTILTGFFGMNFDRMPGTGFEYGAIVATVSMVGLSALLWVLFRRRGWL